MRQSATNHSSRAKTSAPELGNRSVRLRGFRYRRADLDWVAFTSTLGHDDSVKSRLNF